MGGLERETYRTRSCAASVSNTSYTLILCSPHSKSTSTDRFKRP